MKIFDKSKMMEAFESYFEMGTYRSYAQVAKKMKVKTRTIERWARKENWQDKLLIRDSEIARRVAIKSTDAIVDEKVKYRQDIKAGLSIFRVKITELIKQLQADKSTLPIKTMKDYRDIMSIYKELVTLDLTMLGEPTENKSENVSVHFYIPDNNRDKKTDSE